MTQFKLRDQRVARVETALIRLTEKIDALRSERDAMSADPNRDPIVLAAIEQKLTDRLGWKGQIENEHAVLKRPDWRVMDATYRWTLFDWLWSPGLPIADRIASDPVLLALEETPKWTPEFAAALAALQLGVGPGPPIDLFNTIQTAANGRTELMDELAFTAHRIWLERSDNGSPYDHVQVLLPLRIETLFKDFENAPHLWIRLTPDEPSISRHRELVSPLEKEFLQEFWDRLRSRIASPPASLKLWLQDPAVDVAWQKLTARVNAPRAAWLVCNFLPERMGDQPVVQIGADRLGSDEAIQAQSDRLMALPSEIEVWAIHEPLGGSEHTQLGVLRPTDPSTEENQWLRDPDSLRLQLPDESMLKPGHWLTDFEAAKRFGLGGQLPLPDGLNSQSIRALFVVGQTDTSPQSVFAAHANAGTLGIVRLGTPTNTVHGAAASDLSKDPSAWLDVVRQRLQLPVSDPKSPLQARAFERASKGLSGTDLAIPYCPVPVLGDLDPVDDVLESVRFSRSLWPAIWGHFLRDHLNMLPGGTSVNANDAWHWAHEYLYPEGPLPPLRIDAQPYGLLPVTALTEWSNEDVDDEQLRKWEDVMIRGVLRLRREMGTHSRAPTLIGADTSGVLGVLGRDAVTHKYQYRYWMRFQFLKSFFGAHFLPAADDASGLWSGNFHIPMGSIKPLTDSLHFSMGWAQFLDVPLIAAKRRPIQLKLVQLFEKIWQKENWVELATRTMVGIIPDSLCIRLMMESIMLAQAWVGQDENRTVEPLINDRRWLLPHSVIQRDRGFYRDGGGDGRLGQRVVELRKALDELAEMLDVDLRVVQDPLAPRDTQHPFIWEMHFSPERLKQLERAFRATLDTASHRIDPWVTGTAWRRLDQTSRSSRQLYGTGVYGWLDGPFQGKPGPTDAGLLLAPSHAQAVTSIVLRDKFLSTGGDDSVASDTHRWHIDIDSAVARKASELAEECRLGFHIFEVMGRQIEAIVGQFNAIRQLRLHRPLRPGDSDPNVVCHGLNALTAMLDSTPPPEAELVALRTGLSEGQLKALLHLQRSFHGYADLMLADAVHDVVLGQPERAADAMDSAAGLGPIPTLESIRTPASGYRLQSTVLGMVPWVAEPGLPVGDIPLDQLVPARLAEPSLRRYLSGNFANPGGYSWQLAERIGEVDTPIGNVNLSELGLSLVDAALIPQQLLGDFLCAHLGADPLPTDLNPTRSPKDFQVLPPAEYFACRQLWGTLASRPLGLDALLTSEQMASNSVVGSTEQLVELKSRLQSVRSGLIALQGRADRLLVDAEMVEVAVRACLRQFTLWGLVPRLDPLQHRQFCQFVFGNLPAPAATVQQWLREAKASAQQRLDKALTASEDTISQLAKTIAELASSEGRMSILSKWSQVELSDRTGLQARNVDTQITATWLTQIATVRPALSRLEAVQLRGELLGTHEPLAAWSSAPGDPWQTAFVQAKGSQRDDFRLEEAPPQFFVSFGPTKVWESPQWAVGLIDEYSECVPVRDRSAFAGLGFNAPAARAQQAILIAVPPQPRTQLTNATLLQILIETREMTRVRAVRPEDMTGKRYLQSTMWFPASGSDRVRVDNDTQYWSFE